MSNTALSVKSSVEGVPYARVWVDGPVTETAGRHWQSVIDAVAKTPVQAAPNFAYVLVRGDGIDNVDIGLGGDLPAEGPPDFATWQPLIGPMIQEVLLIAADHQFDDGLDVGVSSADGDFAAVYITDVVEQSAYGDPVWCQWAADVVNAHRAAPAG